MTDRDREELEKLAKGLVEMADEETVRRHLDKLENQENNKEVSQVKLLKDFIPKVPEQSEEAAILTQKQANALNRMELWSRLLGLDSQGKSIIRDYIESYERRSMSIGGKSREQFTEILSTLANPNQSVRDLKPEQRAFLQYMKERKESETS